MTHLRNALLALVATALPAVAAPVDLTTLSTNGSATIVNSDELQLTADINSQVGSAFTGPFSTPAGTTFSASFEFMISGSGTHADGLVFIVQNDVAGAAEIGGAGGFLGYNGIAPSVGVEFDTYVNTQFGDPNTNHIGINLNGSLTSQVTATPSFSLAASSSRYAWVDYDGTTLSVFAAETDSKPGTAIVSQAFDIGALGGQAYFGFSAATGGLSDQHLIKSFDLTVSTPAVPVPPALPLVASAFGLLALRRRMQKA